MIAIKLFEVIEWHWATITKEILKSFKNASVDQLSLKNLKSANKSVICENYILSGSIIDGIDSLSSCWYDNRGWFWQVLSIFNLRTYYTFIKGLLSLNYNHLSLDDFINQN